MALPLALSAQHDDGVFGTFTAVEQDCDRYSCGWRGRFVSDDGRTRIEDATLDDAGLEHRGDRARAQKITGDTGLYEPEDRSWRGLASGDVGCSAYVAWWLWARRWRGSREEQRRGASPTG